MMTTPRPIDAGSPDAWLPLVLEGVRRWRLLVGLPFGGAVIAIALSFAAQPQFLGRAAITAESRSSIPAGVSGLAGLASQFGLGLPAGGGENPQFFAEVLQSRHLLTAVLMRDVPATGDGGSIRLLDLLVGEDDHEPAVRLDRGLTKLSEALAVSVNPRTNIIEIRVLMPGPATAAAVASGFVDELSRFNLERRASRAGARRQFAGARLREAEDSLRTAEDAHRHFLERNRRPDSPELTFEADRLRRRVDASQELVTALRREFETARIDEVDDTPVITVLDPPVPPARRSSPSRSNAAFVGGLLGGLLAVGLVVGGVAARGMARTRPDDYAALRRALGVFGRVLPD